LNEELEEKTKEYEEMKEMKEGLEIDLSEK